MRRAGVLGALGKASPVLLAAALVACSEEAAPPLQWTVFVSTDAPLPQFGDRLLVQVFDEDKQIPAPSWHRDFVMDGCTTLPISFGIPALAHGGRFVRAILYRQALIGFDGLPAGRALISVAGALPPAIGVTNVALDLPMDCFGVTESEAPAVGPPARSCDPSTGPAASLATLRTLPSGSTSLVPCSWPRPAPVVCPDGPVPGGMACVPGGVFLLGAPNPPLTDSPPLPERLVELSPFALDTDEMTVGRVADLKRKGWITEEPTYREEILGKQAATSQGACNYVGVDNHQLDALPVNCVSHSLARRICAALGKRLPTEAEWEYAAGNGNLETPYPWGTMRGEGGEVCNNTLVQRGRDQAEFDASQDGQEEDSSCRKPGDHWGPVAGGTPADKTEGEPAIRNLGGNVGEWVEDGFAPYDDPCWHPEEKLLKDPVCAMPGGSPATKRSARGGSWATWLLRSSERNWFDGNGAPNKYTGFRCARSL